MKLLFITQKVDKNDDTLGMYHHWIEKIAEKVESISVICLYKGKTDMPENIHIYSLGKETGASKTAHLFNFFKYIWRLRNEYGVVLVHMNPQYVILGKLFWFITRKPVFMWYNHPMGNTIAKIGIILSKGVFCTSPFSFAARDPKSILMPVGVDLDYFKKNDEVKKTPGSIIFLSRISPIKHLEVLLAASRILIKRGAKFSVTVVGNALSINDKKYAGDLTDEFADLIKDGVINFKPGVPNSDTINIYNSHEIFVNLTPTGSFDKSIIEAMACETLVLVSNKVLENFFDNELKEVCMFVENDQNDLANKIYNLLSADHELKEKLCKKSREIVEKNHGLGKLIDILLKRLS